MGESITAAGEIEQFGGCNREWTGPDWMGLFVGNEGLFGVAPEIIPPSLPREECFHTVLVGYATLFSAVGRISRISVHYGVVPRGSSA